MLPHQFLGTLLSPVVPCLLPLPYSPLSFPWLFLSTSPLSFIASSLSPSPFLFPSLPPFHASISFPLFPRYHLFSHLTSISPLPLFSYPFLHSSSLYFHSLFFQLWFLFHPCLFSLSSFLSPSITVLLTIFFCSFPFLSRFFPFPFFSFVTRPSLPEHPLLFSWLSSPALFLCLPYLLPLHWLHNYLPYLPGPTISLCLLPFPA